MTYLFFCNFTSGHPSYLKLPFYIQRVNRKLYFGGSRALDNTCIDYSDNFIYVNSHQVVEVLNNNKPL